MKLYELTKENKILEELFLSCIDFETGELKDSEALEELEKELKIQLQIKGTGIIKFIKNKELLLEGVDNEIKRLQALKKVGTNNINKFKSYVIKHMELLNTKKIETPLGNLSLRNSSSVKIEQNQIDMEDSRYTIKKVTTTVSKEKIKKLLVAGEEILGATIVKNNTLQIK